MDESSRKVVEMALNRVTSGEVESEIKVRRFKFLGAAVITAIVVFAVGYFWEPTIYSVSPFVNKPETMKTDDGGLQVILTQDPSGHYVFSGEINGKEVTFLLDTGATTIAVPLKWANYLNLQRGQEFYADTANGKSLSYASKVHSVKVGGIEMFDVETAIVTGMEGDELLLGMSFLKHLSIKQENGKIYLSR